MHRIICFLLFCVNMAVHAQPIQPSLIIGDKVPALRVGQWIKGAPVKSFEKGHVYVLEFWATSCKPCLAAMPHLSSLARYYKDKVTFIGIDIYEKQLRFPKSVDQVKAFVDSMGSKMDFLIATEDSNYTVKDWMEATGEDKTGIPQTFVVDGNGRLAWIGHLTEVDTVLEQVVAGSWNVNNTLAERNEHRRLKNLEDSLGLYLSRYLPDPANRFDLGKPDSTLLAIDEIIGKEPTLKYAPTIAYYTFNSLLKTNPQKAYEYGKQLLVTPSYCGIDYTTIITAVEWIEKTNLVTPPLQIYELGAEAYQVAINENPPPDNRLLQAYIKMVDWYWRANNKADAIAVAQKMIEVMKGEQ